MPERLRLVPPWLRWTLGVLAALVVAIVLFLAFFDWNMLRGPIAREASAMSGRPVRIDGNLKVRLLSWTPTVRVERLWIGDPAWMKDGALAQVGSLTVSIRAPPLLIGRVELPLVDLEHADISLFRDAAGRANWRGPNASPGPLKLPLIHRFIIRDGRVRFVDQRRHIVLNGTVESHETDVGPAGSRTGAFALQGAGTLNHDPFTLSIHGGSLLNVRAGRPYRFDADLRAGRTHITARGDLPRPFDFGQVDAALSLTGADFGDLYALTGLALPTTPPYSLQGRLVRDGRKYQFTGVAGRVGDSDLEGDFRLDDTTGRPDLHADLRSRRLNYRDLGSLVGAPPRGPSATPLQKAQAARLAAEDRLLPDATLAVDRVRAMDAVVTYAAAAVDAPNHLPLRQVRMKVVLDHGVLTFDPLSFVMPHGELTGRVRVDARGAVPHDDIDLRVVNMRLEDFFHQSAPPPIEGGLEARAVLHGDGASAHQAAADASGSVSFVAPRGEIRRAFAELMGVDVANGLGLILTKNNSQTGLRCAVANFTATKGVLRADTFVIDTDVVRATGRGDIDLGPETLDLTLKGKPKKLRLLHLSAPIAITGHLKSPKFGLKPGQGPLQAAGAVALGVVLSPVAAILPFVDPGLAKDADCVALVQDARREGAPVRPSATTTAPSKP